MGAGDASGERTETRLHGTTCGFPNLLYIIDMAEKPRYRALAAIDPRELAKFQAGIRKRYTDEQIVAEIVACAERLAARRRCANSPPTARPRYIRRR